MIRARSREQGAGSGEGDRDARNGTQGQAAARGQFALFDKVRPLARWYQAWSWEQGARSGRREEPRYPRKRLRLTRLGIGSRHEDEGPNVYNCVSLNERQAGALALQQDFRSSIPSYSMLHALCSAPHASSRPGDEAEFVVLL